MQHRSVSQPQTDFKVEALTTFAKSLLSASFAGEAKRLIDPVLAQLCALTEVDLHPELFLDSEASITPFGKAVSLTTAAQCAEDPERGRIFIQGIYHAIQDKLALNPQQAVQILYAGTGPFAWLLLPLLPLFLPKQIQVTLLDIHQASLEKVVQLLNHFGLNDRVVDVVCADATLWQPAAGVEFDLIVSETMKHLLQQEPQLQIFSHLQRFLAADGELIPQNIELEAWLLHPQWPEAYFLGPLFALNKVTAQQIDRGDVSLLSGCLVLPEFTPRQVSLKCTTQIHVFGPHVLAQEQCQLTLSRYQHALWLKSASVMAFEYQQGSHPDFVFDFVVEEPWLALPDSEDTGLAGFYHLRRLWAKTQRQKSQNSKQGTHNTAESFANEWTLDKAVLDLCGIGLEPGMQALYRCETEVEFSHFVRLNTQLTSADVSTMNQQLRTLNAGIAKGEHASHRHDNSLANVETCKAKGECILTEEQQACWQQQGYLVIPQVLSAEQCAQSRQLIWQTLGASETEPQSWYQGHALMQKIMLQLFRHPVLDANRQTPIIRQVFEHLWQRKDLVMTTDRVSFNPPETPTWQFPGPDMHWDMPLSLPVNFGTQGLIYLTDTSAEQGAFCCVPQFHQGIEDWLTEQNKSDAELQQQDWSQWPVKPIAAKAGDLIIWHHALPHGASPNRGHLPRMVQYINFYPLECSHGSSPHDELEQIHV